MWFDPAWGARAFLTFDNFGGAVGTLNGSFTVPVEWDFFWANVRTDGFDVRVTQADGRTPLVFSRSSWTHGTRTGVIRVGQIPCKAGAGGCWLYWRNATTTNAAGNPPLDNPKTLSVLLGRADRRALVTVAGERTQGLSRDPLVKGVSEQVRVTWNFRPRLLAGRQPISGSRLFEEIAHVTLVDVLNAANAAQGSMLDLTRTVIGDGVVATWLRGGTVNTNYAVVCQVETTLGRVLEGRTRLRVRNVEAQ